MNTDASTLARTIVGGSLQGHRDGPVKASFDCPVGLVYGSKDGSLYVAETGNHIIRRVSSALGTGPVVETVAGVAGGGHADGPLRTSRFLFPSGLDYCYSHPFEELLVADTGNSSLRHVDMVEGTVESLVDRGRVGGQATAIGGPRDCAFGKSRTECFFTDQARVYRVDTVAGTVKVLAGGGGRKGQFGSVATPARVGFRDGPARTALFNHPDGLAYDRAKRVLFVCDTQNHCVRAIDIATGVVSTVAGDRAAGAGFQDGFFAQARFKFPQKVSFDARARRCFVTDLNDCVRVLDLSDGVVSTVAGSGLTGHQDGFGSSAQFDYPCGIALADGMALVCDSGNHCLRSVQLSVPDAILLHGGLVPSPSRQPASPGGTPSDLRLGPASAPHQRNGAHPNGVHANGAHANGGAVVAGADLLPAASTQLRRNVILMSETADALLQDVGLDIIRKPYFLQHPPEVLQVVAHAVALIVDLPQPQGPEECGDLMCRVDLLERMHRARVGSLDHAAVSALQHIVEKLHRTTLHKLPELQRLMRWIEAFQQACQYLADHTQRATATNHGSPTAAAAGNGVEGQANGRGLGAGRKSRGETKAPTMTDEEVASHRRLRESVHHLKYKSLELISSLGAAFDSDLVKDTSANGPASGGVAGTAPGLTALTSLRPWQQDSGGPGQGLGKVQALVTDCLGHPMPVRLTKLNSLMAAAGAHDGGSGMGAGALPSWAALEGASNLLPSSSGAGAGDNAGMSGLPDTVHPVLAALEDALRDD